MIKIHFAAIIGCAALTTRADIHVQTLKSFPLGAASPNAALLQASDGRLYGSLVYGGTNGFGAIFKMKLDGSDYQEIHSFSDGLSDGEFPSSELIEGSDGALYGTTPNGGAKGRGVVFSLNKDGTGYPILRGFALTNGDADTPAGALVEGNDGALYGTTIYGGGSTNNNEYGIGTVFRVNKDGGAYQLLHRFGSIPNDDFTPSGGLFRGSDGALYGVTGAYGGTVFVINQDGTGYRVLHLFGVPIGDGSGPQAKLAEDDTGMLYGTTTSGGEKNRGVIFSLKKDGTAYSVLHSFGTIDGDADEPVGALLKGSDGAFYGVSESGPGTDRNIAWWGTIFRIVPRGGAYGILHVFTPPGDGINPSAGLIEGDDGNLYGTAFQGGGTNSSYGTVFVLDKMGGNFNVLKAFQPSFGDGAGASELLKASDGALYGAGHSIFRINYDGSGVKVLYSFSSFTLVDDEPWYIQSAPIEASDGALYGTAAMTYNIFGDRHTAIYRLNKESGDFKVIDVVAGFSAKLVEGRDGALHGVTRSGGATNSGSIFRINKDGSGQTTLHDFGLDQDGVYPEAGLILGSDGVLYGTTSDGGSSGGGTVFKINEDGGGYGILHEFDSVDNWQGNQPSSTLIEGSDGRLYGTTSPDSTGTGKVFGLGKDGSGFSILCDFYNDYPSSGAVEGPEGAIYITCGSGIFRVKKSGEDFRSLLDADYGNTSGVPLIRGPDGAFYGTSTHGGSAGAGSLFKFWPPEAAELSQASTANSSVEITFTGESGAFYKILRSTDLLHWSELDTIQMPTDGTSATYTYTDESPASSAAYYRTLWIK